VGTGVGAPPGYRERAVARLSDRTGLELRPANDLFDALAHLDPLLGVANATCTAALTLAKFASDLRVLSSGPVGGIGEVMLPLVQVGSSIMPGKVNPVIAESVAMVCAQVIGNDMTVAVAGQSGNFEINVMMPVAAYNLLQSIELLATATDNLVEQCIEGLRATERGPAMVEQGLMLATALAPVIGYDAAAELAKEAFKTGQTIRELAAKRTNLSAEELDRILDPAAMTEPGLGKGGGAG
jgi:fumarate hydratase class II